MKTIQFIAATIVTAFLAGCGDPNHPVQTSKDALDSTGFTGTQGSTPVKADSINADKHGPDQMVPENSEPTVTSTPH